MTQNTNWPNDPGLFNTKWPSDQVLSSQICILFLSNSAQPKGKTCKIRFILPAWLELDFVFSLMLFFLDPPPCFELPSPKKSNWVGQWKLIMGIQPWFFLTRRLMGEKYLVWAVILDFGGHLGWWKSLISATLKSSWFFFKKLNLS